MPSPINWPFIKEPVPSSWLAKVGMSKDKFGSDAVLEVLAWLILSAENGRSPRLMSGSSRRMAPSSWPPLLTSLRYSST